MKKARLTFLLQLLLAAQIYAQTINDITGPAGSGEFGKTITVLSNGNYVVTDPFYDEGAISDVGAIYLYNGRTRNLISTLKGSTANDRIGSNGITVLTNGNYVVRSSNWDNGPATDAGAITWCSRTKGVSGQVSNANSLVGTTAGDFVGSAGVTVLNNGNFVVFSPGWDNGAAGNVRAITWGNGTTGIAGAVSISNSLVGNSAADALGFFGLIALSNGNYVINSPFWDNGAARDAGAVTWGNGTIGTTGVVSSSNSLVGSSTDELVGMNVTSNGLIVLSNGNYLVRTTNWGNGVGAITWGNGTTGITGTISSSNSLVGSTPGDCSSRFRGVHILSNGNYIVNNPSWTNGTARGAGAITWANGNTGITGAISSSNSLVGSSAGDGVGLDEVDRVAVTELSNGNFVVGSPGWDNGAAADAGAVTLGNGATGVSGVVSSSNSLVGSTAFDKIGTFGGSHFVVALTNGNYLVPSRFWDNGAARNAGAITWCNGTTGVVGEVNSSNSLVGSSADDQIGSAGIRALVNGNYVIASPDWDNGTTIDAGAVTWGSGTTGVSGIISSSNSLVSTTAGDFVGSARVTALGNGNYVVSNPSWDNGATLNAGAVTWGNGTSGISGVVSSSNSLIGSTANDQVGSGGITALSNGNYIVLSTSWDNGAAADAGAVTWGNGTTGITGAVNSSNSLVGALTGDRIGSGRVTPLANGNYVVNSPFWSNISAGSNHGAVTWGNGTTGITGIVSRTNSLVSSNGNSFVGNGGVTALPNGNYLVVSLNYGMLQNSGAVTWGDGTKGAVGIVTNANSLLGGINNDQAGSGGITVLSNGNYVVHTPSWDHGYTIADAGAVTWGNGATGVFGNISSSNSLVGNSTGDRIGSGGITALSDGNFAVKSPNFDNGATIDAGAVTLVNGVEGIGDIITRCNSVIGNAASGGTSLNFAYNDTYDYLIGGRPQDNIVSTNTLRGRARPLAVTLDNSVTTITGLIANQLIASAGCRIIARHRPNGLNLILGRLSAKVWIEEAVPNHSGQPFAARHYEIIPDANASTTTGRITLYFTQAEFDDFNADAASITDLPNRENDRDGIANLRIIKYAGTSSDGSGLPASYSGETETINPNDDNIEWNDNQNRWEVTFNVTGFGGFIVQTAVDAITSRQRPSSENSKLVLYPNPATDIATLSIGNNNLLNTMAVLTDMQGRQVKQFVINDYMERIDISKLPKGMYILKLADGKAMKLTKN